MEDGKVYRALGLMSGTSLDGVDAALIETDGFGYVKPLGFHTQPYEEGEREAIRACLGLRDANDPKVRAAAEILTRRHIETVKALNAGKVDLIGFHGQTIFHDPDNSLTLQIGDADLLARETGTDVIADFRSADVKAGGQGAPLLPLYHAARTLQAGLELPVAILNIGGVANVTYIGPGIDEGDLLILAFDTGPGNALIDDFVRARTGKAFDTDGALAAAGHCAEYVLDDWFGHPFFDQKPPKSLDRDAWSIAALEGLSDADGAATLTIFTAESVLRAADLLPQPPRAWYVTGGGRLNKTIMRHLSAHLNTVAKQTPVAPVEEIGWNGDALEAEGFAYLAVRSLLGQPLSLPGTTGVMAPQTGGRLHKA